MSDKPATPRRDVAIRVEDLGKRYLIGAHEERYRTVRETLTRAAAAPWRRLRALLRGEAINKTDTTIWALRDVSFEIGRGEVVGIVGRNGAGKTTLLKILSRITEPTRGQAMIRGRVGSLLEVGTGFHPELTGRENIYLNSAILGMRKTEVDRKFDQIVEFAELEKFIDTPVKRYSSGMYVRLAFSVAAHLEPDVLLVDEVLAVGDYAFQNRCLGKMNSLGDAGRTILLVSHNLMAVRRLTRRTIWIDGGRVRRDGETAEVVTEYLTEASPEGDTHGRFVAPRADGAVMTEGWIEGSEGGNGLFPMGASLAISARFKSPQPLRHPYLGISIEDADGRRVYSINTRMAGGAVPETAAAGVFTCRLAELPLNQGIYFVTLQLHEGTRKVERRERVFSFQITPRDVYGSGLVTAPKQGCLHWPSTWTFEDATRRVAALDASGSRRG